MIDHKLPTDWKDLQEKVAEIFKDIGYETETEKDIETARGTVKVDVFSIDASQSPNIVYLCQCKHWETRVPKAVVHAFRTVVQDYGANFGLIISKIGFQKGAYEAARNTNIRLVDWFGFQDMFEEKWLPAISEKLYHEFEALIDYTEPLVPSYVLKKLDQLSEEKKNRFRKLREKYTPIGVLILHLQFGRLYENLRQKLKFPLVVSIPTEEQKGLKITKLHSLRELAKCLAFWGKEGLKEFDEIFDALNKPS